MEVSFKIVVVWTSLEATHLGGLVVEKLGAIFTKILNKKRFLLEVKSTTFLASHVNF